MSETRHLFKEIISLEILTEEEFRLREKFVIHKITERLSRLGNE